MRMKLSETKIVELQEKIEKVKEDIIKLKEK